MIKIGESPFYIVYGKADEVDDFQREHLDRDKAPVFTFDCFTNPKKNWETKFIFYMNKCFTKTNCNESIKNSIDKLIKSLKELKEGLK